MATDSNAPRAFRVSVTTAATALVGGDVEDIQLSCLIRNVHATVSIFLGPSNVSTSTGYEVRAGEAVSFAVSRDQVMYAIASETVTVDVLARVSQ